MLVIEDFNGVIDLMKFGVSSIFSMQIMGVVQKYGGPPFYSKGRVYTFVMKGVRET